jgi:hypothetical protein
LIFHRGAAQLAGMIEAVRRRLGVPDEIVLPVTYSGSIFQLQELCLDPVQRLLKQSRLPYQIVQPRLPPSAGAALYAALLSGHPLRAGSVEFLESQLKHF